MFYKIDTGIRNFICWNMGLVLLKLTKPFLYNQHVLFLQKPANLSLKKNSTRFNTADDPFVTCFEKENN